MGGGAGSAEAAAGAAEPGQVHAWPGETISHDQVDRYLTRWLTVTFGRARVLARSAFIGLGPPPGRSCVDTARKASPHSAVNRAGIRHLTGLDVWCARRSWDGSVARVSSASEPRLPSLLGHPLLSLGVSGVLWPSWSSSAIDCRSLRLSSNRRVLASPAWPPSSTCVN